MGTMGTPVTTGTVRWLLADDVEAAAADLATSFLDDPMTTWLAGITDPDTRHRALIDGFFRPALQVGRRKGQSYRGPDGASIWAPPDVDILPEADLPEFIGPLAATFGGEAVERISALGELVTDRHPHDRGPHAYLFILGVAGPGGGRGSALLAPVLARCDSDRVGAYLESSNARNVAFYERNGFRVEWEARPTEDGPVMRGMWRDPR